jgi:hypothetical protein
MAPLHREGRTADRDKNGHLKACIWGLEKHPCATYLFYIQHPSLVPIILLPGINLAGFPSENGRESVPYMREKPLLAESILTLLPTGI